MVKPLTVTALHADTKSTGRFIQAMPRSAIDKIPSGPKLDALTAEKVFGGRTFTKHEVRLSASRIRTGAGDCEDPILVCLSTYPINSLDGSIAARTLFTTYSLVLVELVVK